MRSTALFAVVALSVIFMLLSSAVASNVDYCVPITQCLCCEKNYLANCPACGNIGMYPYTPTGRRAQTSAATVSQQVQEEEQEAAVEEEEEEEVHEETEIETSDLNMRGDASASEKVTIVKSKIISVEAADEITTRDRCVEGCTSYLQLGRRASSVMLGYSCSCSDRRFNSRRPAQFTHHTFIVNRNRARNPKRCMTVHDLPDIPVAQRTRFIQDAVAQCNAIGCECGKN